MARCASGHKPLRAWWCFVACSVWVWASGAPVTAAEPASSASVPPPSCVDVSINQHSVLAFDCLSRALAGGSTAPAAPAPALDPVASEPSNRQVGQYNFSALSHRMGSNLGKSVLPQRPPAAIPPTPAMQLAPGH